MINWLFSSAAAEAVATVTDAAETVVETAAAKKTWLQIAFGKFADFPVWGWVAVAVLLLGGAALFMSSRKQQKKTWTTQMMAVGAICVALSCVLSMVRLYKLPQGGSVTAASMLPMMLFAWVYGTVPGLTLGALYGVMQFILDPWFLSVPQMLLDYPIAFAMVGLAGLFNKNSNSRAALMAGVVIACIGRFAAAVASGVLFFAEYAEGTGLSPMVYSMTYNGSYMAPECVICVVIAALVGIKLAKALRRSMKA